MIRLAFILLVLFLPLAQALTLEESLQAASERPSVATARIELRDAIINLQRTQDDPLAVRLDNLQAEQRLALARASYEETFYSAIGEIASAYTNVLQGREGVEVAQKALTVNETSLEIAQIRVNNGSGTQLDLDEARTALNEAQNSLRSAQDTLNVGLNNLETILNRELQASDLEPVPDNYLVQIPVLPTVLSAAERHPTVVQAEQQLELAQLNSDILDPSYASQSQIDGAGTGLTNAREGVQETTRGFRIQARNLYNAALSAQETYQTEQEALRNANERLQTQRQRFEGGLIARIELNQAELSNLQAELEALQARYGYLTSLLELQSGTLVDLTGPDTLNVPSTEPIEASARSGLARGETGSAPSGSAGAEDSSSGVGVSGSTSGSTSDSPSNGGAPGGDGSSSDAPGSSSDSSNSNGSPSGTSDSDSDSSNPSATPGEGETQDSDTQNEEMQDDETQDDATQGEPSDTTTGGSQGGSQ